MNIINDSVKSNYDSTNILTQLGQPTTLPQTPEGCAALLKTLKQLQEQQQEQIKKLKLLSVKQMDLIGRQANEIYSLDECHIASEADLKSIAAEKQKDENTLDRMKSVFTKIKPLLDCSVCQEPASLPKVVGECGHILCEGCIEKYDEEELKKFQAGLKHDEVIHSYLCNMAYILSRRCPLCRTPMIGKGFPVDPLREIVQTVLNSDFFPTEEKPQVKKVHKYASSLKKDLIAAELTSAYAEIKITHQFVEDFFSTVAQKQLVKGVQIKMEQQSSSLFFYTFKHLRDKFGIPSVLVTRDKDGKYTSEYMIVKVEDNPFSEYPEKGYLDVKAAWKKAETLELFAISAKENLQYIKKHHPQNDQKGLELLQTLFQYADKVHKTSEDALGALDTSQPTPLEEINKKLKVAIDAKKEYAESYIKMEGQLVVSLSVTHSFKLIYSYRW